MGSSPFALIHPCSYYSTSPFSKGFVIELTDQQILSVRALLPPTKGRSTLHLLPKVGVLLLCKRGHSPKAKQSRAIVNIEIFKV